MASLTRSSLRLLRSCGRRAVLATSTQSEHTSSSSPVTAVQTITKKHRVGSSRLVSAANASTTTSSAIAGTAASPPLYPPRFIVAAAGRSFSTQSEAKDDDIEVDPDYHNIIDQSETVKGDAVSHEFQAETRRLLEIAAKSLYSDKEVFLRELISNASDALEKLRHWHLQQQTDGEMSALEIHIGTDEAKKTLIIQDTGIGMTKEELIENLGTIARSGTRAFLEEESAETLDPSSLIGQFGVGFYSTFMVGHKVEVFSRKIGQDVGYRWSSDGSGKFELAEADGLKVGSKILIHLNGEAQEFAKESHVKEIVEKYSNFVSAPIYLNGKKVNVLEPLWLMNSSQVTDEMHEEFYRFIAKAYDSPRFHLHYKTDSPISIRSIFYFPGHKPGVFELSRETDLTNRGIALYSRRVLIQPSNQHLLPKWLRWVKGVVDSEDIPLNLSRELLQDSALIKKLSKVLTGRIIKFLTDKSKKHPEEYQKFFEDYGFFIREGVVTSEEQSDKEDVARLLRFESSRKPAGETVSLADYVRGMANTQRDIYYLAAPTREMAENSPYLEAIKEKEAEVLFCYEQYDDLTMLQLGEFEKKSLKSLENAVQEDQTSSNLVDSSNPSSLSQSDAEALTGWLKDRVLGERVKDVKISTRLKAHPVVVTVPQLGAVRHFLMTSTTKISDEEKWRIMNCSFEVNPAHALVKSLHRLRSEDPRVGELVALQLFDNAMVEAGLADDPRQFVNRINKILHLVLANDADAGDKDSEERKIDE